MTPLPFAKASVLVVGDVMLDRYWNGGTARISPEAPVPVVRIGAQEHRAGGAANVAINLAAIGCQVTLLGLVGSDDAAEILRACLDRAGVNHHLLPCAGIPTITKLRVISRNQQLIRLDFEDPLPEAAAAALEDPFTALLANHELVVLSDYAKGSLQRAPVLINQAHHSGLPVLVDPKQADVEIYAGASLLTPNFSEFEAMAGGPCVDEEAIARQGEQLMKRLGLDALLVTRGEHGLSLLRPGQPPFHEPSQAREVFDVTGAGDTVIAITAAALAAGAPLEQAVRLANRCAGIVVGRLGTASVSAAELATAGGMVDEPAVTGVVTEAELMTAIQQARINGSRIVMTNGCFDILHAGHVHYLEQAKALGDRLVVAVNSDDSVRRLKGHGRPINPLANRLAVLSGLRCVDWVVPFTEDTPERLIAAVLPEMLVKGADYTPDQIAGAPQVIAAGGEVRTVPLMKGLSSSAIIGSCGSATPVSGKEN